MVVCECVFFHFLACEVCYFPLLLSITHTSENYKKNVTFKKINGSKIAFQVTYKKTQKNKKSQNVHVAYHNLSEYDITETLRPILAVRLALTYDFKKLYLFFISSLSIS